MTQFAHLHLHSQYSLLDGANRIADVIGAAVEKGMPAIALTDHGNMFGAIEFYNQARAAGIKPNIGIEAYVAPGSMHDRDPQRGRSPLAGSSHGAARWRDHPMAQPAPVHPMAPKRLWGP